MTENKKYCMGCMKEIDENLSVCPHCYYDANAAQHYPCLPKESIISGRYLVGKVIAMANDSITYIGIDKETEEIVAIHEFFPVKIVNRAETGCEVTVKLGYDAMFRNCLHSFINLWKGIGNIEGRISLPEVRNILDFNGTVYTVCKYLDSITLKAYFEETKKPLAWQKANASFKSLLSALKELHNSGITHGNISPSSVHVGSDGKLHLTAFSIPQCHSQVVELAAQPISGFSPIELYSEDRTAKAYSDVYSVMALIYYCITGIVPPKATERAVKDEMIIPASVAPSLSKKVIACFIKGLSVHPQNRMQSVEDLMLALYPAVASTPNVATGGSAKKAAPPSQNAKTKSSAAAKKTNVKKKSAENNKDTSLVPLALGTFAIVVVLCMFVFSILYTTVLYKSYDIPLLNKAFSSFSFLPMNKQAEDDEALQAGTTTTTEYVAPENNYVTVPDFTAHTYDSINSNEVFTKNFTITYTYEWSEDVPKNGVISQNLTKGESVLSGTTVALVISKGAEQIELPEVIGLQYDDAKKELEDKGFKVKRELLDNSGNEEAGIVDTMDKVAGLEFDKGTEILLYVWDEPEEEITKEKDKNEKNDSDSDE